MADEKKVDGKKTLQQRLDDVSTNMNTFKNEQARKIQAVKDGKERLLKDNLGRNKQRYVSSVNDSGIQGLQTLTNTLGTQFLKK
jgi:hypothetical protein